MGPDHPHHPHGPWGQGGPHGDGFGLWWLVPLVALVSLALLALWLVRDIGPAGLLGLLRERLDLGPRARWRAAVARHREVAMAFAAYECDPRAVWLRPALADVREPATGRFVEAFAEACALATERYPGPAAAEAFVAAVDRSATAWRAATGAGVSAGARPMPAAPSR